MTTIGRGASFATALGVATAVTVAAGAAAVTHLRGPYYDLRTTTAQYNLDSGDFTSPDRITVTRPGLEIVADAAKGNVKAGTAVLRGNVRVHDAGGIGSSQGKNAAPATLTCDELDVDARAETYHATGHPHYQSDIRTADADDMLLDRKHKVLRLNGNVTLTEGEQKAHATAVDADLKTGDVTLRGAPVQLEQPASPRPAPQPSPRRSP